MQGEHRKNLHNTEALASTSDARTIEETLDLAAVAQNEKKALLKAMDPHQRRQSQILMDEMLEQQRNDELAKEAEAARLAKEKETRRREWDLIAQRMKGKALKDNPPEAQQEQEQEEPRVEDATGQAEPVRGLQEKAVEGGEVGTPVADLLGETVVAPIPENAVQREAVPETAKEDQQRSGEAAPAVGSGQDADGEVVAADVGTAARAATGAGEDTGADTKKAPAGDAEAQPNGQPPELAKPGDAGATKEKEAEAAAAEVETEGETSEKVWPLAPPSRSCQPLT